MNSIALQLSEDLQILLAEIDSDLVRIEQITRLPSTQSPRASYKLIFKDGLVLKGRQLESEARCKFLANIQPNISTLPISRVINHHGSGLIEEWIPGNTLADVQISAAMIHAAGEILGRLSQTELPATLRNPQHLESQRQVARTIRHLDSLADSEKITIRTAGKLEKMVVDSFPDNLDTGLVHRDFCADNLVVNTDDKLCSIDNENMSHGYLDSDLARSWYRWPMESWQRDEFISGYELHRKTENFLCNEWYWSIRTLCASAHYREIRQQPVSELIDCLNLLADGDPRGLWPLS